MLGIYDKIETIKVKVNRGKKMSKKRTILTIALCLGMCYIPMQAAGYYRTKNVQYGGANFYYNGVYQSAGAQMIFIDGTTYMPVKALGNAIGLSVSWDQATQTVNVSGNTTQSNLSMQAELQAKDYEIASLKKELQKYKEDNVVSSTTSSSSSRYSATSGTDILGTELTATRKELENTYSDYFKDIDFDFSLRLSSGKLKVTISYDTSSENKAFNKLSTREVKEFIEEVCETIRDYHEDIVIQGTIEYDGSSKAQYHFSYSKKDDISYSGSSSYDDITRSEVIDIVEDTTSIKIEGYSSSISIKDVDAYVSDSSERVTYKIYLELTDEAKTIWNRHTGTDNDTVLRGYLKDIAKDISNETDYDILGEVYIYPNSNRIATYDYDENEVYLYNIE